MLAVIITGAARLPFRDRAHAGHVLADLLAPVVDAHHEGVVVLALPRGGVPVARVVATELGAPLDVLLVRKLGLPSHPELAVGALASAAGSAQPVQVLNEALVHDDGVAQHVLDELVRHELGELRRREAAYRGDREPADVRDRTVIVVDDGLATGASARAALLALRELGPAMAVLAVPVAPKATLANLAGDADKVVCAATPRRFVAVGRHYDDFTQVTDAQVREWLAA